MINLFKSAIRIFIPSFIGGLFILFAFVFMCYEVAQGFVIVEGNDVSLSYLVC